MHYSSNLNNYVRAIVLQIAMKCCYYIISICLLLQFGWTALHHACYNGDPEVVKYLVSNNADIAVIDNVSNYV